MPCPRSARRALGAGLAAALCLAAGAAPAQERPAADVAVTLRADARPFVQAYGSELAGRVFSERSAPERRAALTASLRNVPGFACPARAEAVLAAVFPWRGLGRPAWIERFEVACRPATRRNFLVVQDGEALPRVELAPGSSNADPRLQRDLMPGLVAAAAQRRPAGCAQPPAVTDVVLAAPPEGAGAWRERWQVSQCGETASIEVRFAPSPQGGTTWSIGGR